jgi:hypothetical protein
MMVIHFFWQLLIGNKCNGDVDQLSLAVIESQLNLPSSG